MDGLILLVFLALLAVPLLLSARKQRRQMRETQELQNSLVEGDQVMTTSGLHGTVTGLDGDTVELEIAPGIYTTWLRAAVRQRLSSEDNTDDEGDENTGAGADEASLDSGADAPAEAPTRSDRS